MMTYALIRVTHPEFSNHPEERIVDKCDANTLQQATRKLLRRNQVMPVSAKAEGYKVEPYKAAISVPSIPVAGYTAAPQPSNH